MYCSMCSVCTINDSTILDHDKENWNEIFQERELKRTEDSNGIYFHNK